MKTLKVFVITLISLFIGLLIAEGITYSLQSYRLIKDGYIFATENGKPPYPTRMEIFSNHYDKIDKCEIFANTAGLSYNRNSIIVFGDVYVNDLGDDNSFTHKLSKLTRKPVYNLASAGWGVQHMYYLLKNEEYMSSIKKPDTILFVFNNDLKNRLTSYSFYPQHDFLNLKYVVKNGFLLEDSPEALFLYRSYFYRALERANGLRLSKSKNAEIQQKNFELIERLFEESRRIAEVKYPTMKKFVILRYVHYYESLNELSKKDNDAVAQLEHNMWKKLEDEGFIVIDVPSLSTDEVWTRDYFESDYSLKNETIDIILPKLVQKAGIR